ncbi:hypothetical protein SAMN05421759_12916 [Roseivivax lentus]|uniref:Uncharacterized protein n=1 Tax=Roseivivax lentus TaxID=633194 RepID=A0A1N7Q5Y9_9RHOB|nr:hypothetical protein [Roseivivax lentus]SIT18272.1 hypothetical protein SAMN05421759_12916 [Roseivivax lentus]
MHMRSTTSVVTFSNAFKMPGFQTELPAGEYEVLVKEERLQGVSFEAFRRTATYLMVHGKGRHAGRTEMRAIHERDLKEALRRDQAASR